MHSKSPRNSHNDGFMTEKEQAHIRKQNKIEILKQLNHFNYAKFFPLNLELLFEPPQYSYKIYVSVEFLVEEILNLILLEDEKYLSNYLKSIDLTGEIFFHKKLENVLLTNSALFRAFIENVHTIEYDTYNIEFINAHYLDIRLDSAIKITNTLSLIIAMADVVNTNRVYEIDEELFKIDDDRKIWEFLGLLFIKCGNRELLVRKINSAIKGDIFKGRYGKYPLKFKNQYFEKFKAMFK